MRVLEIHIVGITTGLVSSKKAFWNFHNPECCRGRGKTDYKRRMV
jgi:hypothetical protein